MSARPLVMKLLNGVDSDMFLRSSSTSASPTRMSVQWLARCLSAS